MALFTITGGFTETSGDPWVYEGDITYTGRIASVYGVDLDVALATVDMTGATITFSTFSGAPIFVSGGTGPNGAGPFDASSTRRVTFGFTFNASSGPVARTVRYRIEGTTSRASNALVLRARGPQVRMAGWAFTSYTTTGGPVTPTTPATVYGDIAADDLVVIRASLSSSLTAPPTYTLSQPGWSVLADDTTTSPTAYVRTVTIWKRMVGLETMPSFVLGASAPVGAHVGLWAFRGVASNVVLTDDVAYSWIGTDPNAFTSPVAIDVAGPNPGFEIMSLAHLYRTTAPSTGGYVMSGAVNAEGWSNISTAGGGNNTNRVFGAALYAAPTGNGSVSTPTYSHKLMQSGAVVAARVMSPLDVLYSEDTFSLPRAYGAHVGVPTGPSAAYGVH